MLESVLRIILHQHFGGDVLLEECSADASYCRIKHSDGSVGVVPVNSIFNMGWTA